MSSALPSRFAIDHVASSREALPRHEVLGPALRRAGALGDPLVQDLIDLVLLPLPHPSGLLALTGVAVHSTSRSPSLPLLRLDGDEIQDRMVEGGKSLPLELEFSTPWGAKGRRPSRPRVHCQISVSLGFRARKLR